VSEEQDSWTYTSDQVTSCSPPAPLYESTAVQLDVLEYSIQYCKLRPSRLKQLKTIRASHFQFEFSRD
jgi:hypothetical protein